MKTKHDSATTKIEVLDLFLILILENLKNEEKNNPNIALSFNIWDHGVFYGISVDHATKDKKLYVNQIPREVLRRLILVTSDKNDLILDPMCGTGSTIVAAGDLNRKGIGIDLNKDLVQIWKDAIDDFDSRLDLGFKD